MWRHHAGPSRSTARLRVLLSACLLLVGCAGSRSRVPADDARLHVLFATNTAVASLPSEENAALAWLRAQPDVVVRQVELLDLAQSRPAPGEVLWWHYAATPELPSAAMAPGTLAAIREHLDAGGSLLLTLFAGAWVVPLGLEDRGPNQIAWVDGSDFARWGPDDDRILTGFQSYRGHPWLRRFWGGTYTDTPSASRQYPVARYTGESWPQRGSVVAVAKRYIGVDTDQRVVVEYPPTPQRSGRVLAIGQGLYFDDPDNYNRAQLELLAVDSLRYLSGKLPPAPAGAAIALAGAPTLPARSTTAAATAVPPEPPGPAGSELQEETTPRELPDVLGTTTYWKPQGSGFYFAEPETDELPGRSDRPGLLQAVSAARSGLALEAVAEATSTFDLASPSVLATGRQVGGIEDLWIWPFRVLRGLRLGLRGNGADVEWLDETADPSFVARPEGDSWRYTLEGRTVSVHLAVARDTGTALVLIEVDSDRKENLVATWNADLSVAWPREANHFGTLQIAWDPGTGAVVWRDDGHHFAVWAGFGRTDANAELHLTDPGGVPDGHVTLAVPFDPATPQPLTLVIAAGTGKRRQGRATYLATLQDPLAVWTSNANYYRGFLDDTLDLATPDPTFNDALRWAKVGLDEFRVTTPGLGTGMMAGYAASVTPEQDPWAADHDFLRRPGYGWYFGRDAVWSGLAADAYGGTDLTATTLRFLARYQDVDGKILHEMTPSWSIHYDAADSTPLFLIGLEHHIRATGDRELLRDLWPAVRRAMTFLESTDTDGDGLIENSHVGHGWIEGGKFYGAHTTLYLAGLWAATLHSVASMANWIGDDDLAATSEAKARAVQQILDMAFWDDAGRSWYHGKRADGTFIAMRTIMPAVPMYFGVLDPGKARPLLDLFASAQISADWGARLAEKSNPDYNPRGYHQGMVWPLFSGWTALAEYRMHRPLGAWAHLSANARLYRYGDLGYMPEALDGDRFESAGVTEHQAWSEAMVILPAVEGMLGIETNAMTGTLRVHPHLPGGWNDVVANYVRVGEDAFRLRVVRGLDSSGFEIERVTGANPVQLELSLPFPRSVLVNLDRDATAGVAVLEGETITDRPTEKEAAVVATMTSSSSTVMFRHSRFPEVVQPPPDLSPGGSSHGLRVIESIFRQPTFRVRLEGVPGRRYRLEIETPWPILQVTGAATTRILAAGPGRASVEVTVPGNLPTYQPVELTLRLRAP